MARKEVFDESFPLKIKLADGRVWEINTGDYVNIDERDLDDGLIGQPRKVAWINAIYAGARLERNRIKRALDKLEAKLRKRAIDDLGDDKKPTEKAIEAWIQEQAEYEVAWDRVEKADWELAMINSVKEGLRDRRDSLVALSLNNRREREVDPGKTVASQRARELDEEYKRGLKDRGSRR